MGIADTGGDGVVMNDDACTTEGMGITTDSGNNTHVTCISCIPNKKTYCWEELASSLKVLRKWSNKEKR